MVFVKQCRSGYFFCTSIFEGCCWIIPFISYVTELQYLSYMHMCVQYDILYLVEQIVSSLLYILGALPPHKHEVVDRVFVSSQYLLGLL